LLFYIVFIPKIKVWFQKKYHFFFFADMLYMLVLEVLPYIKNLRAFNRTLSTNTKTKLDLTKSFSHYFHKRLRNMLQMYD